MQDLTFHLLKTLPLGLHPSIFVSLLIQILELLRLQLAGNIGHTFELGVANAQWRGLPQLELAETRLASALLLALSLVHSRVNHS